MIGVKFSGANRAGDARNVIIQRSVLSKWRSNFPNRRVSAFDTRTGFQRTAVLKRFLRRTDQLIARVAKPDADFLSVS